MLADDTPPGRGKVPDQKLFNPRADIRGGNVVVRRSPAGPPPGVQITPGKAQVPTSQNHYMPPGKSKGFAPVTSQTPPSQLNANKLALNAQIATLRQGA